VNNAGGSFDPQEIIVRRLQEHVQQLSGSLQNGDITGAFSAIEHMNAAKEESIYYGLGMLARGLHTAIVNFQVDDHGKAYLAHDEEGAAPVTSQLDNVIEMSEESARKTLNILDGSMPLIRRMREELEGYEPAAEDAAGVIARHAKGLAELESNLMEILMAQGFQDLAGQAIRKVNGILGTLQSDLVTLLTYAREVKLMSEPVPLKLPVMGELHSQDDHAAQQDEAAREAAMSQDSVDDLLSSLGF
jgi:chemotaxis protein CheZ